MAKEDGHQSWSEFFKAVKDSLISLYVGEETLRYSRERKECSKVADHIYLGGNLVARDRHILRKNGITHVLNCAGVSCLEYFKDDGLVYKTLWLSDCLNGDITSILYDVLDYIEDVREQGGRVLVHCWVGKSRSASLVIGYLMWKEKQSFDNAFRYVNEIRMTAKPNIGFVVELQKFGKRMMMRHGSSVMRMYRMAPHSCYDPRHLVPKMLRDPSPHGLDSRGAFIIIAPSACGKIYVWIGKNCEPIMETDAKGSAFQIVRYESVQGPVITIKEGEEPLDFWDAFSSVIAKKSGSGGGGGLQIGPKVAVGERKIVSYDKDFEHFKNAIMGKDVVSPFSAIRNAHEINLAGRESNWSGFRLSKTLNRSHSQFPMEN